MKKFIERLETDKKFAKGFDDYLKKANTAVKKGSKQIANQLNELVIKTIEDYAKLNKMTLKKDGSIEKKYAASCKEVGDQLNEMIVKQFKALASQQNSSVKAKK